MASPTGCISAGRCVLRCSEWTWPASAGGGQVEAEGGVGGAALVVLAGEDRHEDVDVVVDLDAGLGISGAEDPADVLDHVAFEFDGEGQEQGVEWWAVEALADEAGGGGEEEAAIGLRFGELFGDGGSGLLAHLAVDDERFDIFGGEHLDDDLEVFGPAGEHEAVAAGGDGGGDVAADRSRALRVFDEPPVDRLDVFGFVGGLVAGLVHDEVEGSEGASLVGCHLVADRTAVHGHERLEAVAPVGGGGEPQPPSHRDVAYGPFEGHGRDVVAFVDDDQPVGRGEFGDVVAAGEALDHGHVDNAGGPVPATAELPE